MQLTNKKIIRFTLAVLLQFVFYCSAFAVNDPPLTKPLLGSKDSVKVNAFTQVIDYVLLTNASAIRGTSSTGLINCALATKDTFLTRAISLEGSFVSVLSLPDANVVFSRLLRSLFDSVDYSQSVAWVPSRKSVALMQTAHG